LLKKIPVNSMPWIQYPTRLKHFNEFNTKFNNFEQTCIYGGRGVDHSSPTSVEVKERLAVYFYFPSGHS